MRMKKSNKITRPVLLTVGVVFIVLSVVILGVSLWEGFVGSSARVLQITVPGFHQFELKDAGMYGAVYQHRSNGPMPISALSKLDVQILSGETYRPVPVVMNTAGRVFERMGFKGMAVFNFVVDQPGLYTMSAIYPEGVDGPTVPLLVFPQAARNIKQTLVVGTLFFLLFMVLGVLILVKLNTWAPS